MASLDNLHLVGKVAIITGSSSGIGEEIAVEFVRQGASVTLNGRNAGLLDSVAKKCEEISGDKNKILKINGDVTQDEIRIKLIDDTAKHFGKIDILVNNAGSFLGKSLAADFDISRLDAMFDINVRVPFHLTKLAIPHLIKTKGNIINISSVSGLICYGKAEYGMVKAAMNQFTKYTALELGPQGVRANAIAPGITETPILKKLGFGQGDIKKHTDAIAKTYPLGRIGNTEDVAKAAVFLASEGASFITGVIMPIDGGCILQSPAATEEYQTFK